MTTARGKAKKAHHKDMYSFSALPKMRQFHLVDCTRHINSREVRFYTDLSTRQTMISEMRFQRRHFRLVRQLLQIKVHALAGAMDRFARMQPHLHIMRLEAQVYEVLGILAPESTNP
jgi:hypothetical protein